MTDRDRKKQSADNLQKFLDILRSLSPQIRIVVVGAGAAIVLLGATIGATLFVIDNSDDKSSAAPSVALATVAPATSDLSTGPARSTSIEAPPTSSLATQPQVLTNQSPVIRDLTGRTENSNSEGKQAPTGFVDGHALDPDGPNGQKVGRVEVAWGDGSTTTATPGGNNAFSAEHSYSPGYAAQTVTVTVTAYDIAGKSESRAITLSFHPSPTTQANDR